MATDKFSDFISHALIACVGFLILYSLLWKASQGASAMEHSVIEGITPKDAWDKLKEAQKSSINRKNALAVKKKLRQVTKNNNIIANKVRNVYAKRTDS